MDGWWRQCCEDRRVIVMDGRERESCEDRRVIVWTVGGENVARIDGL